MMKRMIMIAVLAALCTGAFAQESSNNTNAFDIKHKWGKIAGYSYQTGYPYGFSLSGGTLLSVGFANENATYNISATENRLPTWSMRCGWVGYTFDKRTTGIGAITFRPMLVMGADWAKVKTTAANGTETSKTRAYFTMAPTLVVNIYMVHFSVGYEFVPRFTQLNGLNFGAGFSIPLSESSSSKSSTTSQPKPKQSTQAKPKNQRTLKARLK